MVDGKHSNETALVGASAAALRLALYSTIAVVLMVTDHHGRYLGEVRGHLSTLTYPIVRLVDMPGRLGRWLGETLGDRHELAERARELEQRWLNDRSQLNRLEALEAENQRLRRLLDSTPRLGDRVLTAELLDVDLDPYSHRVTLNRGTGDGVFAGQPVADAYGVFGQIDQVGPWSANAVLISDPNHAIPVTINRTGLRTIAYGTGSTDRLELRDVSTSADVQVGDLIVSSGLASRFPVGYPVGKVTSVDTEPGAPFLSVMVKPLAELDRARQLLLVWPGQQALSANSGISVSEEALP